MGHFLYIFVLIYFSLCYTYSTTTPQSATQLTLGVILPFSHDVLSTLVESEMQVVLKLSVDGINEQQMIPGYNLSLVFGYVFCVVSCCFGVVWLWFG